MLRNGRPASPSAPRRSRLRCGAAEGAALPSGQCASSRSPPTQVTMLSTPGGIPSFASSTFCTREDYRNADGPGDDVHERQQAQADAPSRGAVAACATGVADPAPDRASRHAPAGRGHRRTAGPMRPSPRSAGSCDPAHACPARAPGHPHCVAERVDRSRTRPGGSVPGSPTASPVPRPRQQGPDPLASLAGQGVLAPFENREERHHRDDRPQPEQGGVEGEPEPREHRHQARGGLPATVAADDRFEAVDGAGDTRRRCR